MKSLFKINLIPSINFFYSIVVIIIQRIVLCMNVSVGTASLHGARGVIVHIAI